MKTLLVTEQRRKYNQAFFFSLAGGSKNCVDSVYKEKTLKTSKIENSCFHTKLPLSSFEMGIYDKYLYFAGKWKCYRKCY